MFLTRKCGTSCRNPTPGPCAPSQSASSRRRSVACGPSRTPRTSRASKPLIWRTRECWRRVPHDCSVPLLRHSRTGGSQARPALERRLPRGRGRTGTRREGDREVHRRAGAREAPAAHKGHLRLPVLLRPREPEPRVSGRTAPGERILGVASGAARGAAGGGEHGQAHGDSGHRESSHGGSEGVRAGSSRGGAPGHPVRGRGEPALGSSRGPLARRGGDGDELRGARGGERPAPVALHPGRDDEPGGGRAQAAAPGPVRDHGRGLRKSRRGGEGRDSPPPPELRGQPGGLRGKMAPRRRGACPRCAGGSRTAPPHTPPRRDAPQDSRPVHTARRGWSARRPGDREGRPRSGRLGGARRRRHRGRAPGRAAGPRAPPATQSLRRSRRGSGGAGEASPRRPGSGPTHGGRCPGSRAGGAVRSEARRRNPFEEAGVDPEELEKLLPEDPDPDPPTGGGARGPAPEEPSEARPGAGERTFSAAEGFDPTLLEVPEKGRGGPLGRRSRVVGNHGHPVGDREAGEIPDDLALAATVRSAAPHQRARDRTGPGLVLRREDLRTNVREGREGNLVLFVVDASGSMAARRRMSAVKGAVLSLLSDAYQRRDKVALISFRGEEAHILLPPTSGVELATSRLEELPTGGRTSLAAGLEKTAEVLERERLREKERRPLLVVLTDGRATAGPDPCGAAAKLRRLGVAV